MMSGIHHRRRQTSGAWSTDTTSACRSRFTRISAMSDEELDEREQTQEALSPHSFTPQAFRSLGAARP